MMMLGLKSGPQIAAKTGIPAGLLFRRIWYSVWKSGVLGITEYRQGRPLYTFIIMTMRFLHCIIPDQNELTEAKDWQTNKQTK